MISVIKTSFIFLLFTLPFFLQAQIQISGRILSAHDTMPITGAAVYFDGTSIGVASGEDGSFIIKTDNNITSSLIINALGYKTQLLQNPGINQDLGIILLEESQESLDEVYLETDPWSRQRKLNIFKKEFLGNTATARQSKIQNEDVISLRYIPSTETLVAYADEPLKIINKYLGYEVTYNLTDFKVEFNSASGLLLPQLVYFEGYSFFEELRKKPSRRSLKNREKAFKGSSMHFMRSLADQKLSDEGFRIFHKGWEVLPYSYFGIEKKREITEVELLEEKLIIVHGPLIQSAIHSKGKFYIDSNGNFTPPQNVLFSGEMSKSRVADMLPLNYSF